MGNTSTHEPVNTNNVDKEKVLEKVNTEDAEKLKVHFAELDTDNSGYLDFGTFSHASHAAVM